MGPFELRAGRQAQVPEFSNGSGAHRPGRPELRAPLVGGFAALACVLLSACGGAEPDSAEPSAREPRAEAEESVFDPLTSTLDRAESVQDTVNQRAEELRRRIEEEEQ